MTVRRVALLGGSSQLAPLLVELLGPDVDITVTTTSTTKRWAGAPHVREVSCTRDNLTALRPHLAGAWDAIVSLVPIAVLPPMLDVLEEAQIGRLVALTTASVYTKANTRSDDERRFLDSVHSGEQAFHSFTVRRGVPGVLLRAAMTYGGSDNNIGFIKRMAQRLRFFPVVRPSGLRQPVHVDDVAHAVLAAMQCSVAPGNTYVLAGGETLTFEEMVRRVLRLELGHERVVVLPPWVISLCLALLARIPRLSYLDPDMARRMREDHVFDISAATRDLGFHPRRFLERSR